MKSFIVFIAVLGIGLGVYGLHSRANQSPCMEQTDHPMTFHPMTDLVKKLVPKEPVADTIGYTLDGFHMTVVVIDSCEYLCRERPCLGGSHLADLLTHKGNCRFCAKRK